MEMRKLNIYMEKRGLNIYMEMRQLNIHMEARLVTTKNSRTKKVRVITVKV